MPKLADMILFSTEKTEFIIFGFPLFSGYAIVNPGRSRVASNWFDGVVLG